MGAGRRRSRRHHREPLGHRALPRPRRSPGSLPIDSWYRLGHHSGVAISRSPDEHQPEEDTALLIAALNHAWAWYDAQMNRGLQVVNYFFVAGAVLATAYVSAINGKHYAIATVLALAGIALTTMTFFIGLLVRQSAYPAGPALDELRQRVFGRLKIESVYEIRVPPAVRLARLATPIAVALALLLNVAALLYAVIH